MKRQIVQALLLALFLAGCNLPVLAPAPTQTPGPGDQQPDVETSEPVPPLTEAAPTPAPTATITIRLEEADTALFEGDYDLALREYQQVLDTTGDAETQAAAMLGMGRANFAYGNLTACQDVLNRMAGQFPQSPQLAIAYYYLGQCQAGLGNHAQAAQAFASALALRTTPIDGVLQDLRAAELWAAGDLNGALMAYDSVLRDPNYGDTTPVRIKIAQIHALQQDFSTAIREYLEIYDQTQNDYTRAQLNYLLGQAYIAINMPEQAYARYQDSVNNFPRSYDSYLALIELVNAGQPVDELNRGLVDYFAGQYGVAVDAFQRYMEANPDHDATALYYLGLSLRELDRIEEALAAWDEIILNYPGDRFYDSAVEDKAYTLWAYLNRFEDAAQTLLNAVAANPQGTQSAYFLFSAARIYERNNQLAKAATTWERVMDEYPAAEQGYRALFLAGISYYRLGDFTNAEVNFQRNLVLTGDPGEAAQANLWLGKVRLAQGDSEGARQLWQQAAQRDPTGYYSERAQDLLDGLQPFTQPGIIDLGYDLERERDEAEQWLRSTFKIDNSIDLSGPAELANNIRFQRGNAFWELGMYDAARAEFETLRLEVAGDAIASYRLVNHFLQLHTYRLAILTSRQILNLAGLDDASTLKAPAFFNHIRFGAYFRKLVVSAANEEGFSPLFIFSLIRQESLFEATIGSSAGARGLMQIMPATGQEIAANLNWPPNFTSADLLRPNVNIRLGTHYLARQYYTFQGDMVALLAAYNGGPGNALIWYDLAGGDPDLLLEVIRYDETRKYIMQIAEFFNIYRLLYERN